MDCIFCQIVNKKIPAKIVHESENLLAFPDIDPSADVHLLIVPKAHLGGVHELSQKHGALLAEVYNVVNQLVEKHDLQDNSYRIVVNGGKAQHVPHLHFHLLGGQLKKLV